MNNTTAFDSFLNFFLSFGLAAGLLFALGLGHVYFAGHGFLFNSPAFLIFYSVAAGLLFGVAAIRHWPLFILLGSYLTVGAVILVSSHAQYWAGTYEPTWRTLLFVHSAAFPLWGGLVWAFDAFTGGLTQGREKTGVPRQLRLPASNTGPLIAGGRRARQRVSVEDRACVIGPPGTGKTALLVTQLLDWAETGRSAVVLDTKPELEAITRERLTALGYRVVVFNPTSETTDRYNPFSDAATDEEISELASTLIAGSSDELAVFFETARDFVEALALHLAATGAGASLVTIDALLNQHDDLDRVLRFLTQSPSDDAANIARGLRKIATNERLLGSVYTQILINLRIMRKRNIRNSVSDSDFSLHDLINGRVVLFLQFEEQYKETTARLFSLFIAHVMRFFIAHTDRQPVLLLLDEIGNAKPIPGLVEKLNTIRSRNLPTWLYWQSTEQMAEYGPNKSQIILGACDVQACFRLNDNTTADEFARGAGNVDVVTHNKTERGTLMASQGDQSTSHVITRDYLIEPAELRKLPVGDIFILYRGQSAIISAPRYYEWWPEFRRI